MGVFVATEPTVEPISLAYAKGHLHVGPDDTAQDARISGLISAAREHVEQYLRRTLVETELTLYVSDRFPSSGVIELARPPFLSIAADGIAYTDADGSDQTLAASEYVIDASRTVPHVRRETSVSWPGTERRHDAVRVTWKAGYATTAQAQTELDSSGVVSSVPTKYVQAMLLLVSHWFENREAVVVGTIAAELPQGVKSLLRPTRVPKLAARKG